MEWRSRSGNALRDQGKLEDSEAAFRRAVELNPNLTTQTISEQLNRQNVSPA
ncbi:MAG: tetratricopeptide repeat protein [Phormidium sp. BM_Day4_Bin.17]|nr:tetratricopeptide repeat protein [Phormidium sp. BM_Day4_Bin.17]UCJ14438.1 MAG: tetratricopeptide repeat protein [Phormidium sp. PBR-2020]